MKLLIYDQDIILGDSIKEEFNLVICADGKYAPCQGCFKCWTKNPATCVMKDSLHEICRVIGKADDLVIVTENWYGGYSPLIKNLLDRSIGLSTPMSTCRGGQMHHTLRYGGFNSLKVYVVGDINHKEKETWSLMVKRNAINWGCSVSEVSFNSSLAFSEETSL